MKKLFNKGKYWFLAVGTGLVSLSLPFAAQAQNSSTIATGIVEAMGTYVISPIIGMLGNAALILIDFLIKVVSYTGYMTSPAVANGWIVVRDVANMFFVAMFLVIAIGTIVNPGRFQGIKAVSRLLVYAIFVNFSKLIVGVCIDISNIIMLTFVNGFKAAAGGNFVDALGMRQLVELNPSEKATSTLAGLIGAQILALVMMIIIVVLIGIILIAMVMRVVNLWFLTVISPLAFAMGATEFTKSRYSEWWKRFSAQLTTGPLVAFFLWLTLATVQQYPNGADIAGTGPGTISGTETAGAGTQLSCSSNSFCQESVIMRFVIASLMLLGGLMFAKEFEGVGGELAGMAWSRGKKYATGVGKRMAKIGAIGVGVAATGGVGAAVGAGYLMSRTNYGKGVIGRAGTGLGRQVSNLQQQRGALGAVARFGTRVTGLGAIGRAVSTYGSKQLAEADKTSREKMQYYSPAQVEEVLASPLSSYADRRAAALKVAKDSDYRKASSIDRDGNPDPKGTRMLNVLKDSMKILSEVKDDKDVADAIDAVKDVRPEAMDLSESPVNFDKMGRNFNVREKGTKLRLDLMAPNNRAAFLAAMNPDDITELRKRQGAEGKRAIDEWQMGSAPTGSRLSQQIADGTVDVKSIPSERYTGRSLPNGQRETEVNTEFAREVVEHGNNNQVKAFLSRKDIDKFAGALKDQMRERVNLQSHEGFTGSDVRDDAQHTTADRMTADNMRLAQTAVMAGANFNDIYHATRDGNFTDRRMRNSFAETMRAMSPEEKAQYIFNLPPGSITQNGPVNHVTEGMIEHLGMKDIEQMVKEAKTPSQQEMVRQILNGVKAAVADNSLASRRPQVHNTADSLTWAASQNREVARFM